MPHKKVLIADDNPDLRAILTIRLEINGYDVIIATDGENALDKVKSEKPDILILDLMMPRLTGFEVCRMIKFDDGLKSMPIIVLSALDQQHDREQAIQNGADAYFIKPFDLELLLYKIKGLIGDE